MATIGDLLSRLEAQVNGLRWTPEDTASAHAAGWISLAKATAQAITWLPLGGRSDQVKAGIRNVLAPLARAPLMQDEVVPAAPQLLELATTVGAVSDSLAGIFRWGPRPEQVGTPALALEAEILSAVHLVARWSRAVVEVEGPAPPRPPLATFLGDLIIVTEPYALIPPQRRASTLEDLAFTAPSSPGLEGAIAAWAETAGSILDDRFRVSGWALQTVAADLALVAMEVRRHFVVDVAGSIQAAPSTGVSDALKLAVRSWRRAAAWPPHVRLGGQNPDLRRASRDLRQMMTSRPISSVEQARRVLGLLVPVAAAHARCMSALMKGHELWIYAPFLVPMVPYEGNWIREPSWSREGQPLLLAAETGDASLHRTLIALGAASTREGGRGERPRWSPLAEPIGGPSRDATPVAGAPVELRGSPAP